MVRLCIKENNIYSKCKIPVKRVESEEKFKLKRMFECWRYRKGKLEVKLRQMAKRCLELTKRC